MKILSIRTLAGPNVFHHKPVLVATLDLGDLAETHNAMIPGFVERLRSALPGIDSHRCSPGYPGGFIERLREGTYFGHISEHIALELSDLVGISVGYGKTISGEGPGIYQVAVRYESEEGMRYLLRTAVELAEAAARGLEYSLTPRLEEARRVIARAQLGPSTQAIVKAAEARGIPWWRLNEDNLLQLGYGKNRRLIQATTTTLTSDIGVDIAQDKELTKRILRQASIRVPRGGVAYSEEEAVRAFQELGVPAVVKPLDGHQGKGASINLRSAEEVRKAFELASRYGSAAVVEEYWEGEDYRVLVVAGRLVAASHRLPAQVRGDGRSTVEELVEAENRNPLRGRGHSQAMSQIDLDEISEDCLARQGLDRHSVPQAGAWVRLRLTANLSTGGTAEDATDIIHPDTRAVCERAARVVGLDVCGIDLILPDLSRALTEQRGGIIEVNAGPGIRMHHYPSRGKPRDAGAAIVDMLYPQGQAARVPIVSVTGTNGKTTVTRMIGHVLSRSGRCVGMTTTDGIHVGEALVEKGDTTGPASARAVLCDPGVEVAVLETARGGIVRRGLGYDWSDVGVLTNIQADHIGQDGIESIEDILRIKSLVAERVREGGTLVLNADDERLARLTERPAVARLNREVVYFSLRPEHVLLRRHVESGKRAYYLEDGWIVEAHGSERRRLLSVADIPSTFNGTAFFQIQNALAAAAACRALDVSEAALAEALTGFDPIRHNKGRANLFAVRDGYLLLDYGHNLDAFRAVADMASRWSGRRVTGIIALPGDRSDPTIRTAAGAAARGFHKILVREDGDLRGRRPGEVASLIRDTIGLLAPSADCRIILDETTALSSAIEEMIPDEVIVLFYEDVDKVRVLLDSFGARPIEASALSQSGHFDLSGLSMFRKSS